MTPSRSSQPPRISLLAPDVSGNSLGMVVQMAGLLRDRFPVEMVAPDKGAGVNSMYTNAPGLVSVPT